MVRALTTTSALLLLLAPAFGQLGHGKAGQDAPASPAQPSRAALDRQLREILAQPEFERAMRAGNQDSRDLRQWLLTRLRRLFDRLGGLHETNYALFLVTVGALTILLVALLAHITYTIVRALRSAGRPSARPQAAPTRPQTADDLRREAEALAARGEFRDAIRVFYLALIRALQVRGVLSRASSRTNWEHLRQLHAHPELAAVLKPFTETFDAKWYGRRPASAGEVERCREWFETALREVDTP